MGKLIVAAPDNGNQIVFSKISLISSPRPDLPRASIRWPGNSHQGATIIQRSYQTGGNSWLIQWQTVDYDATGNETSEKFPFLTPLYCNGSSF